MIEFIVLSIIGIIFSAVLVMCIIHDERIDADIEKMFSSIRFGITNYDNFCNKMNVKRKS